MVCQERLCATIGRSHLARPTQSTATQIKRRRDLKVPLCAATSGTCASTEGPVRAEMRRCRVTPNARSPADSGCSLRDPCRSALRPIATYKARSAMSANVDSNRPLCAMSGRARTACGTGHNRPFAAVPCRSRNAMVAPTAELHGEGRGRTFGRLQGGRSSARLRQVSPPHRNSSTQRSSSEL
jgi:hypothetical protein